MYQCMDQMLGLRVEVRIGCLFVERLNIHTLHASSVNKLWRTPCAFKPYLLKIEEVTERHDDSKQFSRINVTFLKAYEFSSE